jgi:hypothetical protein
VKTNAASAAVVDLTEGVEVLGQVLDGCPLDGGCTGLIAYARMAQHAEREAGDGGTESS